MKIKIMLSFFIFANLYANIALSAEKKKEVDESKVNAKIIQTILSSIDRSSLDFEFEIATDKDEIRFNDLDFNLLLQMKQDMTFSVFEDENSKFKTEILLKTKNLIMAVHAEKQLLDGKLSIRFYSGFDPKTKNPIIKPLTAVLANKLRANLITLHLNSIDIISKDDVKNPNLMHIKGNCQSTKEIFNFVTSKIENKAASCYVEGTIEEGVGPKLKAGYKNSQTIEQMMLP